MPHTITSKKDNVAYYDDLHYLTDTELCKIGSYPTDYNFNNNDAGYLIGISVPPIMTYKIAIEIQKQWLNNIK